MALLSDSLKAFGMYIKFAQAVQGIGKSGTPRSIAFLSFSPRCPVCDPDPGLYSSWGGGWEEAYRVCSRSRAPHWSAGNYRCLNLAVLQPLPRLALPSPGATREMYRRQGSPDDWRQAGDTGHCLKYWAGPCHSSQHGELLPSPPCLGLFCLAAARKMGSGKVEERWPCRRTVWRKCHTSYSKRNCLSCCMQKMPNRSWWELPSTATVMQIVIMSGDMEFPTMSRKLLVLEQYTCVLCESELHVCICGLTVLFRYS